jgi:hypothetical protein
VRKESIDELLEEVKEIFQLISSYKKISRPKVKSILEHLRSSLEYAAQDINSKLVSPKQKLYFPYGNNEIDFEKSIKRNLPNLINQFPEIYIEIKKIQNFKSGNDWLIKLCNLTNVTKHNNAIDVRHDEEIVKSVSIFAGGVNLAYIGGNCSNIRFTNTRINGKLMDDFIFDQGEIKITKKGDVSVNFKITKDRKIIVGEDQTDLLPFLEECIKNTEQFINDLYQLL